MRYIFSVILLTTTCSFAFADGKVSVLSLQDASKFPAKWSCQMMYRQEALTVGQVLQMIEVQPTLSLSLKAILGVDANKKLNIFLFEKSVAYLKNKKTNISDCSNVKINELFQDVDGMNSCSNQENLAQEMNRVAIPHENFNFSNQCIESVTPKSKGTAPSSAT